MAPQFTAMNGASLRLEQAWIARATSSLPVPDSPCTSTGAMLRATRSTSERTCCIACERPARRDSAGCSRPGSVPGSSAPRGGARAAHHAPPCAAGARPSADATTLRNWRRSTGLVR